MRKAEENQREKSEKASKEGGKGIKKERVEIHRVSPVILVRVRNNECSSQRFSNQIMYCMHNSSGK